MIYGSAYAPIISDDITRKFPEGQLIFASLVNTLFVITIAGDGSVTIQVGG